eukprot:2304-Heterococcus_DN1.PRE.5
MIDANCSSVAVVVAVLWDLSAVLVHVLLSDSVVGLQSVAAAAVTMCVSTNPLAYTLQTPVVTAVAQLL